MGRYDPDWVRKHYKEYGEKEWGRWDVNPTEEAKLHVHGHYVRLHVRSGQRVLEIGPGPGRFTVLLAELGARITALDISETQLTLHRKYGADLGFEPAVDGRIIADVCAMEGIDDESFDTVVCYGGPLSYVFERRTEALAEIRRVLRPGGEALLGVMSLWGAFHEFLPDVLQVPLDENRKIVQTGDLHPETFSKSTHHCHMYRAAELKALLEESGFDVLAMSASNCITAAYGEKLAEARKDPDLWQELLGMEVEASAEPGCLDMGTHIIAVARK